MSNYELADEIYSQPQGVKGHIRENWVLENRGGIFIYVRAPTKDELDILKKARDNSHPDKPTGSHDKFLEANKRYEDALAKYQKI